MRNNYNERSWAIDVITEINLIVSQQRKTIRRAGGERTLKASTKASSLFPDVLLFQDDQNIRVLQGWELKMPDTPISDHALLDNAIKKALLLGLNSFLVWNVCEAALYVLDNGNFKIIHQWDDLKDVTKRDEVEANKARWVAMLSDILKILEQFFATGVVKSQSILESFSENKLLDVILGNIGLVAQNIKDKCAIDAILDAQISDWWENLRLEYSSEPDKYSATAKQVLLTWINRFLFTHYLKKFTNKALEIDDFSESTSIEDARSFFKQLTDENDFLNVFAPVQGEELIDPISWEQMLQLNSFLSDLDLQNIDQSILQQFFEQLLLVSKRKSAGQYATPYELADYFSRIVITDKTKNTLDAFCGTGTILRAIFDLKLEFGVSPVATINSIWGSDKFSFPLQMSTLSLAKPEIIGQVINVFKADVKNLATGNNYNFTDPNTGNVITKQLPEFQYIISNLPFVESSKIDLTNPQIKQIISVIAQQLGDARFTISNKSDLIAYLPYYLWHLLSDNGRLGIIVSNSWLGTDWGASFRETLSKFFKISTVVSSGEGKWFNNAKVITNLVILEKRGNPLIAIPVEESTDFVLLNLPLSDLQDKVKVKSVATSTLLKRNTNEVSIQTLANQSIAEYENYGIGWSAFFTDLSWFNLVKPKLIKVNTLFEINRGERRGWDPMFYPEAGHGIEADYIKPVLKNFRNITKLIGEPDDIAFCCSKTEAELQQAGATGALAWINKFKNATNETGVPLTTSLRRANLHWYEMSDSTVADLVSTINYGETIFIAKMRHRSFVNQRLIRFTMLHAGIDLDLCHALLNSFVGIFYIEAMGFGRGMGALDLSSTKMRDNLCMLDPNVISPESIQRIKDAFTVLQNREIEKVPQELLKADRIAFENEVAQAYGLRPVWPGIKESILKLHQIRTSVR